MKLHIDNEAKTIALEGKQSVQQVFNLLMSWFPEDWEQWSFVPFKPSIEYKEIIVEKQVWKNPYWQPFKPFYYSTVGLDIGDKIPNQFHSTTSKATINLI